METIEFKSTVPFELTKNKPEDEQYGKQIEAYATTWGNKDVVNDVVAKGAADKFVKNFDGSLPMLLNHDVSQIIGKWTKFEVDEYGLKASGELNDTSLGKDVQMLVKDGMLNAVSIGFRAYDYEFNDDGGRTFKEIDLFELSVVLFPANRKAEVTSVKEDDGSINPRAIEATLRDVGLTQKERKILLAGGLVELMKQRDVLDEETRKQALAKQLMETIKCQMK